MSAVVSENFSTGLIPYSSNFSSFGCSTKEFSEYGYKIVVIASHQYLLKEIENVLILELEFGFSFKNFILVMGSNPT